tara:strand:+ start:5365 stop:6087 length:723 start_codon:yes stop_codon:yes gene_type:complete
MDPIKTIQEINSKHNLKFNEAAHRYTIENSFVLESVTTKLKNFFPFDAKKVSQIIAEQRGVTPETIIQEWNQIRDNGTRVHLLAERFCNKEELTESEKEEIKHVIQFFEDNPHFEVLGSEVRVFSKKYVVAGTVDLMLRNIKDNKVYLLDWKTSAKEIECEKHWEMARGLLSEIPHNKYHNYSMQLSVYTKILKETYNIDVQDTILVHLRDNLTYRLIEPVDLFIYAEIVLATMLGVSKT